jgi:hypothetical protein
LPFSLAERERNIFRPLPMNCPHGVIGVCAERRQAI